MSAITVQRLKSGDTKVKKKTKPKKTLYVYTYII